jgi:hypothetical protein
MAASGRLRWHCSWNGEECTRWAQANGQRLCQQHFCLYEEQQRLCAATGLADIINNNEWIIDAAAAENVTVADVENFDNQAINNDCHDVVGDLPNDAAASVGNVADNIDNNDRLIDAAPVKNTGNHAINNDCHDVANDLSNDADAPVCNIADSIDNNERLDDSAPVENIGNHKNVNVAAVENVGNQAINNDCHDVAGDLSNDMAAPVGNVPANIDNNDWLVDAAPVEYVGNHAINNDCHDAANDLSNDVVALVYNIADSKNNNEQMIDAAPVENVSNHAINNDPHDVTDGQLIDAVVGNGNNETHYVAVHNVGNTLMAPTIRDLNDQMELRDQIICDLEARIVELESKLTALSDRVGRQSNNWFWCTLPNS